MILPCSLIETAFSKNNHHSETFLKVQLISQIKQTFHYLSILFPALTSVRLVVELLWQVARRCSEEENVLFLSCCLLALPHTTYDCNKSTNIVSQFKGEEVSTSQLRAYQVTSHHESSELNPYPSQLLCKWRFCICICIQLTSAPSAV